MPLVLNGLPCFFSACCTRPSTSWTAPTDAERIVSAVGHLSLTAVFAAAAAGALLGAQTGYVIGRRLGPSMLDRPDRPRLQRVVIRSRDALGQYGIRKAIVLARFVPLVPTVLNPMAGTVGVSTRIFTVWQVAGGLVWTLGVTNAGFVLGSRIPGIDTYLLPIIAAVVAISLVPVLLEFRRSRRAASTPAGSRSSGIDP